MTLALRVQVSVYHVSNPAMSVRTLSDPLARRLFLSVAPVRVGWPPMETRLVPSNEVLPQLSAGLSVSTPRTEQPGALAPGQIWIPLLAASNTSLGFSEPVSLLAV